MEGEGSVSLCSPVHASSDSAVALLSPAVEATVFVAAAPLSLILFYSPPLPAYGTIRPPTIRYDIK